MKIKFGIMGSGWRSELYMKIASAHPEIFEITSVYVRNNEKKEYLVRKYNINATNNKNDFLNTQHDFVVEAVSKANKISVLKELADKNIPVLLETPAGTAIEELEYIWSLVEKGNKIQVAEQYQYYPYYNEISGLIENDTLGNVDSLVLSSIHGYHAASIARKILGIRNEAFSIIGNSYRHSIVETDSRNGIIEDGRIAEKEQSIFTIEFEGNKQFLYFFNPVQYHSRIRSNSVVVYGERGEVNNFDLRYITKQNEVISKKMEIADASYEENDKYSAAICLQGMERYIESGVEFYSMENALNDAYMSILMDEAVCSKKMVKSKKQIWQKL